MKFRVKIDCSKCHNELDTWVEGSRQYIPDGWGSYTDLWEIQETDAELYDGWTRANSKFLCRVHSAPEGPR